MNIVVDTSVIIAVIADEPEKSVLKQEQAARSALDVEGINLNVSTEEIVEILREGREHSVRG